MIKNIYILFCLFCLFITGCSTTSTTNNDTVEYKINTSATYYWDNRDFGTLSLSNSINDLPIGLSLWGFTDFHGSQNRANDKHKLTHSFSEYRLTKSIGETGLGTQLEYNYSSGSDIDVGRLGLVYKHDIPIIMWDNDKKSWLQWRLFPLETDGDGGQASLIYVFPITERFSLSGFMDLNLHEKGEDRLVIEPQLNFKLKDNVILHLEYRYNEYQDSNPNLDGDGWAIGIEYKF
jgi:uncharacterized protein YceK